jgi:hypothetical protein
MAAVWPAESEEDGVEWPLYSGQWNWSGREFLRKFFRGEDGDE